MDYVKRLFYLEKDNNTTTETKYKNRLRNHIRDDRCQIQNVLRDLIQGIRNGLRLHDSLRNVCSHRGLRIDRHWPCDHRGDDASSGQCDGCRVSHRRGTCKITIQTLIWFFHGE